MKPGGSRLSHRACIGNRDQDRHYRSLEGTPTFYNWVPVMRDTWMLRAEAA